jgi:hypothetical protein
MDQSLFPLEIAGRIYTLAVLCDGGIFCDLAAWPETMPAQIAARDARIAALEAEVARLRAEAADEPAAPPPAAGDVPTCPDCGRTFKKMHGLRVHRSIAHFPERRRQVEDAEVRAALKSAFAPDPPAGANSAPARSLEPTLPPAVALLVEPAPFRCDCGGAFTESLREPGRCIRCTGEYRPGRAAA